MAFFPRLWPVLQLSIAPPISQHTRCARTQSVTAKGPFSLQNKVSPFTEWAEQMSAYRPRTGRQSFFGTPGALICGVMFERGGRSWGPPLCFYLSTSSPSQICSNWHKWRIDHSTGACIYGSSAAHLLLNKWASRGLDYRSTGWFYIVSFRLRSTSSHPAQHVDRFSQDSS